MTTAVMIPWDSTLPVQLINLPGDPGDDAWVQSLKVAVFNQQADLLRNGTVGFQTLIRGVGAYLDDDGLRTQPTNVNIRAMKLYAHLAQRNMSDYRQVLAGNWIIVGLDPHEGEAIDAPASVRDYFAEEGIGTS